MIVTDGFKSAVLELSNIEDRGFIDAAGVTEEDMRYCSCVHLQVKGGRCAYTISGETIDGKGIELKNGERDTIIGTQNIKNFKARALDDTSVVINFEMCE